MHRETILVVLAVLVCASPYFGLPYLWLVFLLPLLGLLMLFIALSLRMDRKRHLETRSVLSHEAPPDA